MTFEIRNQTLRKYTGNEEHVIVPEGITSIADYAFYGASSMRFLDLPGSLKEIGSSAFYDCENLESLVMPDSVCYIGEGLFARCRSLRKVIFSDRLSSLPRITFFRCEDLEEAVLPARLKTIGRACFEQCHSLKHLTLPETLQVISENAFDDCSSLQKIELPESLREIGDNTFFACTSLRHINIPDSLQKMGKGALETRGKLSVISNDTFLLRSYMFDNNWNMNWNFGANHRYNGKNEDNYQLVHSYMPCVSLKEWKPEARCILAVNYLETRQKEIPAYEQWIRENSAECLDMIISRERSEALHTGAECGLFTPDQIRPYLEKVKDPDERAWLLAYSEDHDSAIDDLYDLL